MEKLPHNRPQSIADLIERVLRSWPRDRGTGRVLEYKEFHPVAAAAHAVARETYEADPRAPERFLTEYVGITDVDVYHVEAFWEIVPAELGKPFDLREPFQNPATTLEFLAEEVRKRRRKILQQRYYAERTYVVTVDMSKIHPTQLQNLPDKRIEGEYKPKKELREHRIELEELVEWSLVEDTPRFLREAKQVLPRRQYQVLERRFNGQSNKEIASALGITESMVRDHHAAGRRNKALKKLAKKWALREKNL